MKVFLILLLGVIFLALTYSSAPSVYADHTLRDGKGIFKDRNTVNLVELGQEDSKYQIHLLVEVRTAQGQLISITEASHSQIRYIGYETLSQVIQNLGEKEIITIDGTKFEKVQHVVAVDAKQLMAGKQTSHFAGLWLLHVCGVIEGHGQTCIPILKASTSHVFITEEDVITNQWTILRELD